jgi:hypothetical protein
MGSRHFAEGAYDRIAKQLFQDLHVDTYMLEYDTERAGGFEPLQYLPKGKTAILGVVTSKFAELEDKAEMVKRVRAAADYVAKGTGQSHDEALKQLGVSPQCGFARCVHGLRFGSRADGPLQPCRGQQARAQGHGRQAQARPRYCRRRLGRRAMSIVSSAEEARRTKTVACTV